MAGVDGVAHGLSSSWSGLKRPPRSLEMRKIKSYKGGQIHKGTKGRRQRKKAYRMSKKGDWERPEKESMIPVEGSAPDKEAPAVKSWCIFKCIHV